MVKAVMGKKRTVVRSAVSGRFVDKAMAKRHPRTTVTQRMIRRGGRRKG